MTTLQQRVLAGFFQRERSFVLTGGGALAGFRLGHRETSDLDLFTRDPAALEPGRLALREVAEGLGATHEVLRESPTFARALLRLGDEGVVVDLVADTVFQVAPEKLEIDGVVVDRPEEILANKLTALVGRQEERDLVDVFALERSGLRVEDYLDAAFQKDGGCTPGTLA